MPGISILQLKALRNFWKGQSNYFHYGTFLSLLFLSVLFSLVNMKLINQLRREGNGAIPQEAVAEEISQNQLRGFSKAQAFTPLEFMYKSESLGSSCHASGSQFSPPGNTKKLLPRFLAGNGHKLGKWRCVPIHGSLGLFI